MSEANDVRPADAADRAYLGELVGRANGGDAEALRELRRVLDDNPQLWRRIGDLQEHAESAWIRLASEGDALATESIRRTIAELRRELGGEAPGAVERLAVGQVVALYLEVKYLETATASGAGGTQGQVTLRLKRLESAQRRFAGALRMLALIRRLIPGSTVGTALRVVPAASRRA